jgi:hypothetical protein
MWYHDFYASIWKDAKCVSNTLLNLLIKYNNGKVSNLNIITFNNLCDILWKIRSMATRQNVLRKLTQDINIMISKVIKNQSGTSLLL